MAVDRRVLGRDSGSALVGSLPRLALELLEFAYVTCFLFVPGGLAVLVLAGHRDAADRFWTLVLLGEFGSFAMLPWIQTRPPRAVEPPGTIDRRPLFMRRMNRLQVNTVSIGAEYLPERSRRRSARDGHRRLRSAPGIRAVAAGDGGGHRDRHGPRPGNYYFVDAVAGPCGRFGRRGRWSVRRGGDESWLRGQTRKIR